MKKLEKYSFGVGDRFTRQGRAQLAALLEAKKLGVDIVPVWNKSFREHSIIHTQPDSVRAEADAAVKALGWKNGYYVDADHIGLKNVDLFISASDFFTLDVADFSGKPADQGSVADFIAAHRRYIGKLRVEGIDHPLDITEGVIESAARKYLLAVQEAGKIYRHVEAKKGKGNFITEVSIDETDAPQSPVEMLFILRRGQGGDPRPDCGPQVHRPLQQGGGLCGRPGPVRKGVQRGSGDHRLRRPGVRPAREPEAQRPLGE